MHEGILKKIGLTDNESKIYAALLKRKLCLVSQLVADTKLNRTHIYDRLKKLMDKGLVSYVIKSGKKYFNAISPDKLMQMLEDEEIKIQDKKKELQQVLPELKKITEKEEISIEVLEGTEGLKTLLQDILKERKEVYIFGFTGAVSDNIKYSYPHYQNARIKLRIPRKVIADNDMRNKEITNQPLTQVKFLPEKYKSPSAMWTYGYKSVIFLPDKELYMVWIKSKKVSTQYRNYFEIMWKASKK